MNSVNLTGRLGSDPESRYTNGGKHVVSFRLAVSVGRDETIWLSVEAWNQTADSVAKFLKKGAMVGISGRLKQDEWEDRQTGQKRSKLLVVANRVDFLSPKGETSDHGPTRGPARGPATRSDHYERAEANRSHRRMNDEDPVPF